MHIKTDTHAHRAEFYNSVEWRGMHDYVLHRDNYECQWCKEQGRVTRLGDVDRHGRPIVLEVDHIKELEHYPDLAMDPDNLRTLCKDCHNKRHHRMNYSTHQHINKPNKWKSDERWD
ncbi:gp65 protein [Paucilactobacillus hokkaidonensis JCM 18461]|uniref:Gp65 protein n=2 Tax=Paucilactobacillus hokkaidonensis TaxID=1193095 RepID=A0A0A1GT93_9LACO|nr:gp65 protein [Paucilactobacillus hokkaidonensis JCM 18461]